MADVGIEYGIALFELAVEKDKKEKIYRELIEVRKAFKENKEYLSMLASPAISKAKRLELVDSTFPDFDQYVTSFIKTLCKNNHLDEFFDAFYHFETLYNESENIQFATVTTSIELSDDEKTRIQKLLDEKQKANVKIKYLIDKDIIGGIVIDVNNEKLDGSLKKKLNDIRKVITR